ILEIVLFSAQGLSAEATGLPLGWEPRVMGEAGALRDSISELYPEADWSDPATGILRDGRFMVHLVLPVTGEVEAVGFLAWGDGWSSVVARLCAAYSWLALDEDGVLLQNRDRVLQADEPEACVTLC
ncbi:MAG TPA: hypothetical protein VJ885_12835, partial [Thermoanaerobaculia bacterium]|nr:hypothetical protein [Thermoanaerobaculia bacterium]